jgi:hypothetical protein
MREQKLINFKLSLVDYNKKLLLEQYLILQKSLIKVLPKNIKFFIKLSPCIKKKNKKLTILKSPFVHKTAREQFQLTTFECDLILHFNLLKNKFLVHFLLSELLKIFKSLNLTYKNLSYNFNFLNNTQNNFINFGLLKYSKFFNKKQN